MLDYLSANQNIDCTSAGTSSSLDDDMDPLFDNDWLHEHNLDILFDLFEQEVERKGSLEATNSNSYTTFGSSPVTSYLFGTSPSLASALDLYDLLYFDNQQAQQPVLTNSTHQQPQPLPHQNQTTSSNLSTSTTNSHANSQASKGTSSNSPSSSSCSSDSRAASTSPAAGVGLANVSCNIGSLQQASRNVTANPTAISITNAMKIKRRFKKGQSEGVSLLARPLTSNSGGSSSGNVSTVNKINSDKTSAKLTNLKKSITNNSCSGSIDINRSKQSHQNRNNKHHHHHHHHVHYMTGYAIIREHAYAVRGH